MHTAFAIAIFVATLGQIETTRPEIRPLEMKYRVSQWDGLENMHAQHFDLGSPRLVGHWVVFSLSKYDGGGAAFHGRQRRAAEPTEWEKANCIDKGDRSEQWSGLLAYDLDSGRTTQLIAPNKNLPKDCRNWVSEHGSIDEKRCALIVEQQTAATSGSRASTTEYLWEWNLEQGTVRPLGEFNSAALLRLVLDPGYVDVFPVSEETEDKQTIALREKPRGPLNRLTISPQLRPGPAGGSHFSNSYVPALIHQPDQRSFILFRSSSEPERGRDEDGRIECFDSRSPGGKRWILRLSEIRKATGTKSATIYPVDGLSRDAHSIVIAVQGDDAIAVQFLITIDKETGKIRSTARLPKPAEDETRHGPLLSPDGSRAVYIVERVSADTQPPPPQNGDPTGTVVSIDPRSGAVLSRTRFDHFADFMRDAFALDSKGRILLATRDGVIRATLGKPDSCKEVFSLSPAGMLLGRGIKTGTEQLISASGLKELQNVSGLEALTLFGLDVFDPMLVELGRIRSLKKLTLVSTTVEPTKLGDLTNVRSLLLHCDVTDADTRQLARLAQLEELEIALDVHASNDALVDVSRLTNLRSLGVNGGFGEKLRAGHLRTLKNLTSLKLDLPVADDDLAALDKVQNLKRLDFVAARHFTGAGLRHLRGLPLADLRMSLNCVGEGVFDQIVAEVADFSHLRRLRLADENTLSANVLGKLSRLPRLTHIDLHWFGVQNGAGTVDGLANCARLSDLDLTQYQIKRGDLDQILRISNLKRLDLSSVQGWRADPRDIGQIEGLEELTLSSLGPPWPRLADGCLAAFATLTKLKRLSLSRNSISDIGLESLSSLKNLEQLNLAHTRVTDRGLLSLSRLDHLADLDLFDTAITDDGLRELQKISQLRSLDLGMTQITDAGLKHLSPTHLRRLSLNATSITDASLKAIAAIDSLEELDLSCTEITNAGLCHLNRLKHLRALNLTRTGATDASLKELKKLPSLATLRLGR